MQGENLWKNLCHIELILQLLIEATLGYEEFCRSRRVLSTYVECFIVHSKYFPVLKGVSPLRSLFSCSPKITQPRSSPGFLGQRLINLQQAALLTSLVQYDEGFSKFGQQQLLMGNYTCGFNQSEMGKNLE